MLQEAQERADWKGLLDHRVAILERPLGSHGLMAPAPFTMSLTLAPTWSTCGDSVSRMFLLCVEWVSASLGLFFEVE